MSSQKPTCPDCGPVPTSHGVEYSAVLIDWLFSPTNLLFDSVWRACSKPIFALHLERLFPFFAKGLTAIGLGKIITRPEEHDTDRTKCLWAAADAQGITLYKFKFLKVSPSIFVAQKGREVRVFDCLPRPRGLRSKALQWMDNKATMSEKFGAAGIPVPRGGQVMTVAGALKVYRSLHSPAITKPNIGSRSRHTTINITDEKTLVNGFKIARKLSPWVMVQEHIPGMVHRATVIGGTVVGVMRREPPYIIGDGTRTVRELAVEENKNPLRHGPVFHEIPFNDEADAEIARQGIGWGDIPEKGHMIILGPKVGRGSGGINADVTDVTHPDNLVLFKKVGDVLRDPLVGIDFIIEDITKPWHEQKAGVIECNSMPFIDLHHFPYTGKVRDAAGALWRIVF